MHVISILSIIVSIAAVLVSIFLYILAYRRDEKERYLPVIGWLNLIVGISMGIVVISTLITPISEGRLSSVFILAGVLIVSAFILVQVVFLISTRSFFQQQQDKRVPEQDKSQVFDVIASNSKEPGNLDELDRLFCEYVRSNFNKVPTILSEISPDVENIFVPTRAYDKPQIQKLIKDEAFTDPLDLLDEEYEQWLYRSENARDLLDILSRESRNYCVLLGEPGAGKTTFMKYLAWKVAATNTGNSVGNDQTISSLKHLLPVYISLHEFATYPSASLFEFIVSYYNTIAKRDMNGKFGELFKHKLESGGKVLLLLDGLDEAYTGATRREAQKTYERVCRSISRFAQENNKAELHLLVTSRKASYKSGSQLTANEGEEFKTLEMAGLLPEDVEQFIQNEFNLQSMPREANNLIMLLQLDQRLREMSVNPLLLTFITMIFLRGGHVSANRSWLYEQCVDYYLQKWDRIRAVERFNDFSRELKDTLLEELAWKYHKERRYVFEEDDLRKELEHLLRIYGVIKGDGIIRNRADPLVDRVLHEIIANSGLLTNFSISSYGFTFFVFQEYFASRYALERVDIDEELGNSILRYWGDFWWEDAIFMLATQLSSTSVWLERLMNTRDDFFNTSTLLAGRTLADQRLPGTAPASQKQWDIIEKLFTRLNETRYRSMSDEIVKTLVEVASPVVNRRLLHVLIENSKNQESSIVNDSIIKYLGQWGNCIDPVDETYIDLIKELKESLKDSQENGQQYSISIRRVILHALEALEGSAKIGRAHV